MMNRMFSFLSTFFFCFVLTSTLSNAQSNSGKETLAPFQINNKLPSFDIRLLDSVSLLNSHSIASGKLSIFILFSPDCDHCAALSKEIKNRATLFDSVNLWMLSPPMPFAEVKKFSMINGIAQMPNIVVGIDMDFFFGSFFRATTVPFVVIYDQDKKWRKVIKDLNKLDDLVTEIKKL
jgi:peroxiredoxin